MTDIELYNSAKEAYYNGTPIMEDFEFDELEKKLGLENKSYIGTRHNPSYTIKHPFVMGSLAKVQIHEKNSKINWKEYTDQIFKFIHKRVSNPQCIITPKFDGCSFEACVDSDGVMTSISSRGDGEYGKDLLLHLGNKVLENVRALGSQIVDEYVLRGEVLIDKTIFDTKYSEFVNPRSFVSGVLNRDFNSSDEKFMEMLSDLSIVIYDIRVNDNGEWKDRDWNRFKYPDSPKFFYSYYELKNEDDLKNIYSKFEEYRNNDCPFALDGIVIKPTADIRINNLTEHRPSDCVAIKFVPQLQETEVIDIEWSSRKTNELIPVVVVKPVIMDGKSITRASGHNWGYCVENGINIGAKVILSLAGDIIPFIYKITKPSENMELLNTVKYDRNELEIDGCHLRKVLNKEETIKKNFMNSITALNIPSIGNSAAERIFEYEVEKFKGDEFFGIEEKEVPDNILLVNVDDVEQALGGKLGKNAKKEFEEVLRKLKLSDIIMSLGYKFCGNKVAEQIERCWLGLSFDFSSMPSEGYRWIIDGGEKMNKFNQLMMAMNTTIDDFKITATEEDNTDKIPVILTGEPNNYATKAEFLKCNPQYRLTGSWKEVQIVFTNSMDSNTGKMKNARAKGIRIELY